MTQPQPAARPAPMDETAAQLDALEGKPRTVEAFGQRYEVAPKMALMPLLRFAHLARTGMDSADDEALAAMYDLLHVCFTEDAWERFQIDATDARADDEDLLAVVRDVIAVMSTRPTKSPSDSSVGQSSTSANSTGSSSFGEYKASLGLVPITLEGLAG